MKKLLFILMLLPAIGNAQQWNAGTDSASVQVGNYPTSVFWLRTFITAVDDTLEMIAEVPKRRGNWTIADEDSLWQTIPFQTSATGDTVLTQFIWRTDMPRVVEFHPYDFWSLVNLKLRTNGRFSDGMGASTNRQAKEYLLVTDKRRGQ